MPVSFTAAKSIGSGHRHHREKWWSPSSELSALCKDPAEQWRAADKQARWRIGENPRWCWKIRPNLPWQKAPTDTGKCSGSPPVSAHGDCDRDDDREEGNRFITAGVDSKGIGTMFYFLCLNNTETVGNFGVKSGVMLIVLAVKLSMLL